MLLHIEIFRISILRRLGPPHVNIFVQFSDFFLLLLLLRSMRHDGDATDTSDVADADASASLFRCYSADEAWLLDDDDGLTASSWMVHYFCWLRSCFRQEITSLFPYTMRYATQQFTIFFPFLFYFILIFFSSLQNHSNWRLCCTSTCFFFFFNFGSPCQISRLSSRRDDGVGRRRRRCRNFLFPSRSLFISYVCWLPHTHHHHRYWQASKSVTFLFDSIRFDCNNNTHTHIHSESHREMTKKKHFQVLANCPIEMRKKNDVIDASSFR